MPDAGAGTGFLALLLARQGHQVTAVDLSAAMLQILTSKAAPRGPGIDTTHADAASPPPGQTFDAVVERHLLWTCPPEQSAGGLAGGGPRRPAGAHREILAAPAGHYPCAYR